MITYWGRLAEDGPLEFIRIDAGSYEEAAEMYVQMRDDSQAEFSEESKVDVYDGETGEGMQVAVTGELVRSYSGCGLATDLPDIHFCCVCDKPIVDPDEAYWEHAKDCQNHLKHKDGWLSPEGEPFVDENGDEWAENCTCDLLAHPDCSEEWNQDVAS